MEAQSEIHKRKLLWKRKLMRVCVWERERKKERKYVCKRKRNNTVLIIRLVNTFQKQPDSSCDQVLCSYPTNLRKFAQSKKKKRK